MSEAASAMDVDITFTDAAAGKVKRLIDEENNPDLKLRIYIRRRLFGLSVRFFIRRKHHRG